MDVWLLIDALESLPASGKRLWGKVLIDEEAFFIGTSNVRKALPFGLRDFATSEREAGRALDSLRLIDELEKLVENSQAHIFGKVLIDEKVYAERTTGLRQALRRDLPKGDQFLATSQSETADLIDEARAEAARIVEEARQQAEHILEDARLQAARLLAAPPHQSL